VRDVPGALAEITRLLGAGDTNIIEVKHQRAFTNLPLQSAEVEFVLQTRGLEHLKRVISELSLAGYKVRLLNKD